MVHPESAAQPTAQLRQPPAKSTLAPRPAPQADGCSAWHASRCLPATAPSPLCADGQAILHGGCTLMG